MTAGTWRRDDRMIDLAGGAVAQPIRQASLAIGPVRGCRRAAPSRGEVCRDVSREVDA